ncbi:MAG: glycerol-3-phosphate dehydrogenase subunit GlpB [Deltaproteobacteria bacterium]|nr:glycerol-3-phosphate dehydrogenase subunit GlpB [Deltaproteobacteria bacterium]MBW2363675.1 glycerol-3-phosphate dehydrogenase subunit GlpB [Deltaproteobacteria bacterium]
MNYDCIIIGGGIAGLTCGIKCASEGLRCAIISSGMSALHFSSGSIDLLGSHSGQDVIKEPYTELNRFIEENSEHPYKKCGADTIKDAFSFFQNEVSAQGLDLFSNEEKNHFHVTPVGTLKTTFLSQQSVFNKKIRDAFFRKPKIAVINIDGFRDFYPAVGRINLKKNRLFKDCEIITGSISLPDIKLNPKNPHEFRSIDICRIFDSYLDLNKISSLISSVAGDADIVGIPAFLGLNNYTVIIKSLREKTGYIIYEIPTLPPSILGIRLDNILKSRYAELGGVFIAGDRVIGGKISNGILEYIHTENHPETRLYAGSYVLSTGSFFSGGMTSNVEKIQEPVFDLAIDYDKGRENWRGQAFFHPQSHPFLSFGVKTNDYLNPYGPSGELIENLFCTGAVLSHYDPVKEGTGSGVAISTGFLAGTQIVQRKTGQNKRDHD